MTKNLQILAGPGEEEKEDLKIRIQKQLGSGTQADVYQVRVPGLKGRVVTKTRKIYNNEKLAEETLKEMLGEFCIAKDLLHPSIVKYRYFMRKYDPLTKNYEFHILIELMEGSDMEVYLQEQGHPYLVDSVKSIGGQLISGLSYLHQQNVLHQDLKPKNILFSGDYEKVKLVDLGVSNRLDMTKATKVANQGTLRYMAPEQLDGSLSFKTDVWSFGCVLLQFCTGLKPYHDIDNDLFASMKLINEKINPLDHALSNPDNDLEMIE